ncbi:unnamed protein product [Amaranthus hypochondriacus]
MAAVFFLGEEAALCEYEDSGKAARADTQHIAPIEEEEEELGSGRDKEDISQAERDGNEMEQIPAVITENGFSVLTYVPDLPDEQDQPNTALGADPIPRNG